MYTEGWWGYVEFATSAIKAQVAAARIVADGYIIKLVTPSEPAPAYAAAAQALAVSSVEEANRPQFVHALHGQADGAAAGLAGSPQTMYSTYGHPAYGYDPNYGKSRLDASVPAFVSRGIGRPHSTSATDANPSRPDTSIVVISLYHCVAACFLCMLSTSSDCENIVSLHMSLLRAVEQLTLRKT